MIEFKPNYHPLNAEIQKLRKAYRNPRFLEYLRKQRCWSCPATNDITASHILRGYHGLKNHDWASVPMCMACHWMYEYHKDKFVQFVCRHSRLPILADAEKYFQMFLVESGFEDDRTEEQKSGR